MIQLFSLQICRGLNYGEYRCRTEKDVAMICALQYYAEHGVDMKEEVSKFVKYVYSLH